MEKLVERLRADGGEIPDPWEFRRLYPGHWGRAAGAWSWTISWDSGMIGSSHNVAECLKSAKLEAGPEGTIYAYAD